MKYTTSEFDVQQAARNFMMVRGTQIGILPVKKLNEHASLPQYGSDRAAGADLRANLRADDLEFVTLEPGARRLVKTGIAIDCPPGHYARVAPRSGLAYKHGIDVLAGVIDEDYRGDVGVILINTGAAPFTFSHGERVAQLIIEQYTPCYIAEAEELSDAMRADAGFGSTGTL